MITCELQGGLGNLLFQVSAAYSLALNNDDIVGFDFDQGCKSCTQHYKSVMKYKNNVFKNIDNIPECESICQNHYNEPFFHYREITYKPNLCLHGFFQSYKYFDDKRSEILKLFDYTPDTHKYGGIDFSNSISFHIRRGDYLKYKNVYHQIDYNNYFEESIRLLDSFEKVLVFSDDIKWAKDNFKGEEFIFVEDQEDFVDLYLMSKCRDNIISNSTFSWWGAYLNRNRNSNKKVIAPSKWFASGVGNNTKDIYPGEWQVISL